MPSAKPPHSSEWRTQLRKLRDLIAAVAMDNLGIGALCGFFKREWPDVKGGFALFAVAAVVLMAVTAWVTHKIDKHMAPTVRASSVVQLPYRQYDEREWPPLTDFQAAEWVRVLGQLHPARIGVHWGQEVEARRLFRSIQEVGKQINCEVTANGGYADRPEITIHTRGKNNPIGPALVTLFTQYQQGAPSVPVVLEHPVDEGSESDDNYRLGASIFLPECPQHQLPVPERKTTDRRKDIKKLAGFLESGQQLENKFGGDVLPTAQALHDWGQSVLDYINSSEALGEGYAARFNTADSQPGLEGVALVEHTQEESERWKWIRQRNTALREFIKECSND